MHEHDRNMPASEVSGLEHPLPDDHAECSPRDCAQARIDRSRREQRLRSIPQGDDPCMTDRWLHEERNPWGYRDRLAVAALAWQDAQNDMTQDRGEAHRMLMREASDYRKQGGLDAN